MLEDFISPASAGRLRLGVFSVHIDGFCERLVGLAYRPATIREKLRILSLLARWMKKRSHTLTDLDEPYIEKFFKAPKMRVRANHGMRQTGRMLLEYLRWANAIETPNVPCDTSRFATLMARYEAYLLRDRAVTEGTKAEYVKIARAFLNDRVGATGAGIQLLKADDVCGFLLAQTQRVSPKRSQYIGSALRSFLRFLFARTEICTDLAQSVLTVRQRRHLSIPRHMSPDDVERLLGSCDRSCSTGRRNHAILLLLARLGLRASEIAALELDDLRWRQGEIIVRGKGLIRDRLPLLQDVGEALALYLKKDRPTGPSRCVFICLRAPHRGLGNPSTVSTIVMRALAHAGLSPEVQGAHLLRHSLATTMIRRGASLAEIGQVLRHRSPNTTEIYAKLNFDALRDIAMPWPMSRGVR